jgi:hypothetical protein
MSSIEILFLDLTISSMYSDSLSATSELLSLDTDIELTCVAIEILTLT